LPTLHVHIDESGDFKFHSKGTKFYIFAVAWTISPKRLADDLVSLRFSLLKQGLDLDAFHATRDAQKTRDRVVATITKDTDWQFAGVVVEKCKVNPSIRDPYRFYPTYLSSILKFVIRGRLRGIDRLMIFTDSLPFEGSRRKREAVEKVIKQVCRNELPRNFPFHVYHHSDQSNVWIQVADYCSWAMRRKWESRDLRTYDQLKGRLATEELDALASGRTRYY
jgi:hypothetical protein